jgi:hypothetical protein
MNIIKKKWLYLHTQTDAFTKALTQVKEGDIIVFDKWAPCFIWDDRFRVIQAGYNKFSGYVRRTNSSQKALLEFNEKGEANIYGIEILRIKSGTTSVSKYPSNFAYFALRYTIGFIIAIAFLALVIALANLLRI